MVQKFGREAGAALLFLIGYLGIFAWMVRLYSKKLIKLRSRYTLLMFHVTVRVASQACGVGFGMLGMSNFRLFLAYIILGAEGYFTLVICAFRFLISWHQHNLPSHESWLEPRQKDVSTAARWRRFFIFAFVSPFAFLFYWKEPAVVVHSFLILANVAIIVGGCYPIGIDFSQPLDAATQQKLDVAKIARTSGQSVFLACNFLLLGAIVATIIREKRSGSRSGITKKLHPTLIILLVVWVPLIVRGVYGVLQAAVWSFSFYNRSNYKRTGFKPRFIAFEYTLGVVTEWISCLLLLATFYTSRKDPSKGNPTEHEEKETKA